jgi:hypothetical protein
MTAAVDLDDHRRAVCGGGDDPVAAAPAHGAPLIGAEPADHGHDPARVGVDRVGVRRGAEDGQPIRPAAVAQPDLVPDLVRQFRTAALRAGPEGLAHRPLVRVIRLDRGEYDGQRRRSGGQLTGRGQPVEPVRVDVAGKQVRVLEQPQQERTVRRSAVQDDRRPGERTPQPGDGLSPIATPGDHLGDQRIELGRDDVALGDPGVDPDARSGRRPPEDDPARRRREALIGILRAQPRLDRVPADGRRSSH